MNIHFIVAPSTHLRPLMAELHSHTPITTLPEQLNSAIDYVVADPHLSPTHPDLLQAQQLGLQIVSPTAFLYEYFKHKTRVVITGNEGRKEVLARVLHTMQFYNQLVSYHFESPINGKQTHFADTEFVLLEASTEGATLHPNIALITDIKEEDKEAYEFFISGITKGGILIYNEEDAILNELVAADKAPIRKMEYHTPIYETHNNEIYLITPEGELPLGQSSPAQLSCIEAAKWVCQNMGIDEADFYEAMVGFNL